MFIKAELKKSHRFFVIPKQRTHRRYIATDTLVSFLPFIELIPFYSVILWHLNAIYQERKAIKEIKKLPLILGIQYPKKISSIHSVFHTSNQDQTRLITKDLIKCYNSEKCLYLILNVVAIMAKKSNISILLPNLSHERKLFWGLSYAGAYYDPLTHHIILRSNADVYQLIHEMTHAVDHGIKENVSFVDMVIELINKKIGTHFSYRNTTLQQLRGALDKDIALFESRMNSKEYLGDFLINEYKIVIDHMKEMKKGYSAKLADEIKTHYTELMVSFPSSFLQYCLPEVTAWFEGVFLEKCVQYIRENEIELSENIGVVRI